MKIVGSGGTGLIGTKLVKNLRQRGQEVVAASPSSGVNTLTGEGLAEALAGAQVLVDVANSPSWEDISQTGSVTPHLRGNTAMQYDNVDLLAFIKSQDSKLITVMPTTMNTVSLKNLLLI
jgi:nucleoside-diphosphate-sugar epimerase